MALDQVAHDYMFKEDFHSPAAQTVVSLALSETSRADIREVAAKLEEIALLTGWSTAQVQQALRCDPATGDSDVVRTVTVLDAVLEVLREVNPGEVANAKQMRRVGLDLVVESIARLHPAENAFDGARFVLANANAVEFLSSCEQDRAISAVRSAIKALRVGNDRRRLASERAEIAQMRAEFEKHEDHGLVSEQADFILGR